MLRVVKGNPTPEELAAAVAVVQARTSAVAEGPAAAGPRRADRWADPARVRLSRMPRFGQGAWRTSYWPH